MTYVFDIETDGVNPSKIHCLCKVDEDGKNPESYTDYDDIRQLLQQDNLTLIGHNIVRYDIPVLERLLGMKIRARLIDTLPISWTTEPSRMKHGLESYGIEFGVPKPKIDDWENLTVEEYIHRCSEDVKINLMLWEKQTKFLSVLYKEQLWDRDRFIDYLTFKMECLREQEELGLLLDEEFCKKTLEQLERDKQAKIEDLKRAMPKVPVYVKKHCPKVLYKADGSLSVKGKEWYDLIDKLGLPRHTPEVSVIKEYEEPNPNSSDQIKKWLTSLGWVPENIKFVRDKEKNTVKQIPQIASRQGGGEICDSIKKLADKEPAINLLDGLSVMSHRIGIFKAFLDTSVDGRLYATAMGLTNTLRMQHSLPVVNLPGVDRKWGKEVRGCITADKDHVLCGSDLSGIEDNTKRHYIYKYDPKYVEEMSKPGFDPHLEIAMLAGFLTPEQVQAHKDGKENHKKARQMGKVVNFSATYKVGAETLARNSGLSLKEAKEVLKVYWTRNKAILDVEKSLKVVTIKENKWLLNPVSGFWYSLRADKDKFSTLNQGTAVYVFDVWLMYLRQQGLKIAMQYHDEVLFNIPKGMEKVTQDRIARAIELTNNKLQLNVQVACSVQFGQTYAETH